MPYKPLDDDVIEAIIQQDLLETHYQPICSAKQGRIVGFEALLRPYHPVTGDPVPPMQLFDYAARKGQSAEWDEHCRARALETYARHFQGHLDSTLFVNFDTQIIDDGIAGAARLVTEVNRFDLNPANIVLEIRESSVHDMNALIQFVEVCRRSGFLIALDDIGSGHSNLERVAVLKPDLLKIDRSLVAEIDRLYHKQEVFRSLVNLAHQIGALAVGEGVETEQEALFCLDINADILQGFFLGHPTSINDNAIQLAKEQTIHLGGTFREYLVKKIGQKQAEAQHYDAIVNGILCVLANAAGSDFDVYLNDIVSQHKQIDSIYALDENGIQVTRTVMSPRDRRDPRCFIFEAADRGVDHSYKDYVFLLKTGLARYVTEPYISVVSGVLCRTISTTFRAADRCKYILCVDFIPTVDPGAAP
ncbi:MAG TPA: EAL domain-containing protein [Candidatus Hydrogenedentes bacterium]|nr:EAL domain-containing protein [Candidatus Hydrogenedentota bacterium]HOS03345.1 EAL domain-containing protein [Candidatus Hydrogenedentota bacterium]